MTQDREIPQENNAMDPRVKLQKKGEFREGRDQLVLWLWYFSADLEFCSRGSRQMQVS